MRDIKQNGAETGAQNPMAGAHLPKNGKESFDPAAHLNVPALHRFSNDAEAELILNNPARREALISELRGSVDWKSDVTARELERAVKIVGAKRDSLVLFAEASLLLAAEKLPEVPPNFSKLPPQHLIVRAVQQFPDEVQAEAFFNDRSRREKLVSNIQICVDWSSRNVADALKAAKLVIGGLPSTTLVLLAEATLLDAAQKKHASGS